MSSTVLPRRADGRIERRVEHVMGMPISLALRGRHAATVAGDEAWQAVITQLRRADEIFSTYRTDSIVNRLDRGELSVEECPPEVAEVLALGDEAERISGGAFSIKLPTDDGRRRLDPSGVGKGWATQRASQTLAALDDTDFCLSAGGDMVCHTADPSRTAWRIGIEHPLDPHTLIAVLPIRSGAVATSGTAHRGAHLVDPRTGREPKGVASATVIASSLTWADIDATTAYVHGRDAAKWLQTRPIRSALVVWADGTTTRLPQDPISSDID
ncbi:MAG TPA: FAD:protein FMN transferase [Propionibacteriaceae bacterium]|nr:FAD:protein FMN transferase [Propionibacteriaceae bacterium]